MNFSKKILFVSFYFVTSILAVNSYAESCPYNKPATSNWQFDVAPYLWAINMNGRVGVANQTLHNDQSFSDLLNQLNWGGMLWLGAHYKENLGFFVDSVYASLSSSQDVDTFMVNARNHFGVFTGGISYKVLSKNLGNSSVNNRLELEPYIGARYTTNDTTLTVESIKFIDNQNWTDPIVGIHLNYFMTPKWSLLLMGDIGGTNRNSDASYNLLGALGYKPTSMATIYLGYRDLYQLYKTGSGISYYDWQMRIFGPVLGVNFRF